MFANDIRIVTLGTTSASTCITDTSSSNKLMSDECKIRVYKTDNTIKNRHIQHQHQAGKHTVKVQFTNTSNIPNQISQNFINNNSNNNKKDTTCFKGKKCHSNTVKNNNHQHQLPYKHSFQQHQHINQETQSTLSHTDHKNNNNYSNRSNSNSTATHLVMCDKHNSSGICKTNDPAHNYAKMISCSQFTPTGHIVQHHLQQHLPNQETLCKHHSNKNIVISTKSSTIVATSSTSTVLVGASPCYRSSCQRCYKNLAKFRFRSPSKKRSNSGAPDQTQHCQHQQKRPKYHSRVSAGANTGSKLKDFVVVALAARKCNLNVNHNNSTSSKRKSFGKNSGNSAINCGETGRERDSGESGSTTAHIIATITANSPKHSQSYGNQDKKTQHSKSHDLKKLPILAMTTALTNTKLSPVTSTNTSAIITNNNSSISLANSVSATVIVKSSPTTTNSFTSTEQTENYDDGQINDTKDTIVNEDGNNNSTANESKTSEPTAQTSTANKTTSSTSGSSSPRTTGPSSPNSYTLDFLHSVGVQMTGGANLAGHKISGLRLSPMAASTSHLCSNNSRGPSPGRSVYAYNNMLGNQRQQRYVYGGGYISGSNHENGNHHYPRYHHPQKLTIASFLQEDLLSEPTLTSPNMAATTKYGNCNNYLGHSGRPHSAHYAPQSHRYNHNYYHHQSHYQPQQSAATTPHHLMYPSSRQHKNVDGVDYCKDINSPNNTRVVSDGDQAYYMTAVVDNDNHHHYQSQGQGHSQSRHHNEDSITTKSNTSRSVSSSSSSTSSASSNLSGTQKQGAMKLKKTVEGDSKSHTNYKSKQSLGHSRYIQRSYQYYQHHPVSGNYYHQHRISNQSQHRHYYQQSQRTSITTAANVSQHQNYFNLTYVTPNKNVVPNTGNNTNSTSANNHNYKLIHNGSSSSTIYVYNSMNTTSNYEHHRQDLHQYNMYSQQEQNHQNQQNCNYNKKMLIPNFTSSEEQSSYTTHYTEQIPQKMCTDPPKTEGKQTANAINEVLTESEIQITTKKPFNGSTNIKDYDSDTSSTHSSAILNQCHQTQKYQTGKSLSNSSSSTSSVASGTNDCNSVNATSSPLTMLQVPIDHNYRYPQYMPQLASSTDTNIISYAHNILTPTITVPNHANPSCHNGVIPMTNGPSENSSSSILTRKEDEFKSTVQCYPSTINGSGDDQQLILNGNTATTTNTTILSSRSTSSSSGYWSPSQQVKQNVAVTINTSISIDDGTSLLSLSDFDNLQCQPQNRSQSDLTKMSLNFSSSLVGEANGLIETKRFAGSCPSSLNQQRLTSQQQQPSSNSPPSGSSTGLNSNVRSRNSSGRSQQLSAGLHQATAPSQTHAFVHQQQSLQQSPISHNMMYCNSTVHMRSVNGSTANNASLYDAITMHTPPDRFLARAHLIEVKEPPTSLVNNSKWDQLSQSIWKKFVSYQQTQETFKQKMHLWRYLYLFIKNTYPRFGLYLVGSTISGFGADSSDVDMCLVSRSSSCVEPRIESLYNLTVLRDCLSKSGEFEHFNLIEAKVPILRFRDRIHQIEVDLNFNNCVGIKNTHLLYCYSQLDWRLRPLVLVVKLWAQYHNINNAKNMTISSYSLVLMVIHFLQYAVNPPVLPCLHDTYPEKFPLLRSNEFGYVDMNELIDPYESKNSQTLGELFLYFLEYYSCFDYTQFAISVRTGGLLPINVCRTAKSLKNDIHQWKELCIEEPFDLTNTARSVYDFETFERVKAVFAASWHILQESLDLNTIFSPIISSITSSMEESESYANTRSIVKELTIATAAVTENNFSNEQCNDKQVGANDKQITQKEL